MRSSPRSHFGAARAAFVSYHHSGTRPSVGIADDRRDQDMHPSSWAAVLRHIPAEQQHQFTVVTASGTEISLQSFLRIEDDFAVVKGRLSGSQDAGRVFFLPFVNIDYFATTNPIKDEEFQELFGTLVLSGELGEATDRPVPITASPQGLGPTRASGQGLAEPRPAVPERPAIRSEVLERFRSRSSPS